MFLCDFGPMGAVTLFDGAQRVLVARTLEQVIPTLAAADAARAQGAWEYLWTTLAAWL